jgi:Glycosyl transferase family 11
MEFVSVHVRRIGYEHHLKVTYKNATIVGKEFYQNSMNWLIKQANTTTLLFIVISDDLKWATENIAKGRDDVFLPGRDILFLLQSITKRWRFIKIIIMLCLLHIAGEIVMKVEI